MNSYTLEIAVNAEGNHLAYLGKTEASSTYRIAGPKAWGGKRDLATLKITESDLVEFIKSYAPEIIPLLNNTETDAEVGEDLQDVVSKAMRKAFQLGQVYWQQADSEYFSQNKKCDETQAKFEALVEEVRAEIYTV